MKNQTTTAAAATTPTVEAANLPVVPASSKLLDRIMKQRAATAVRVKTCGISDLFKVNVWSKKFNSDGVVTLPVVEISAKFIPKYKNDSNNGYLTSYTTESGELFTSFSSASLRFFEELLTGLTGQPLSDFSRLTFDAPMLITIAEDTFSAGIVNASTGEINNETRKTYRFDIIGGNTEKTYYLDNNQLAGITDAVIFE